MLYSISFKTKWADFDPNNHMRHSAYNDYAAEARVRFFSENHLSLAELNELKIGPILFQEVTNFYKEIRIGEDVRIELYVKGLSEDGGRFKFQHKIIKENGVVAAVIEVYGAWLDLAARKLTVPPEKITSVFNNLEKTNDFEIIISQKK